MADMVFYYLYKFVSVQQSGIHLHDFAASL